MRKFYFSIIVVFLLLADFLTKAYTHLFVLPMSWVHPEYPFGGMGIFDLGVISFSLNYVQNLGAAWGMFSGYSKLLVAFRICIITTLIIYTAFFNSQKRRSIPLIMILCGAIGNVSDFFVYGHVIDMLHFKIFGYTPFVFNLADSYISLGLAWLFVQSWYARPKLEREQVE